MGKIQNEIEIQIGAETSSLPKSLQKIVIIPIVNSPIFPGMIAPIVLTEDRFTSELEEEILKIGHVALNLVKVKSNKPLLEGGPEDSENFLDPLDKKAAEEVTSNNLYKVGVVCKVVKKLKLPDGSVNLLVHGLRRYRAGRIIKENSVFLARPEVFEDVLEADEELDAYTRSVINQVKKLSELNPYFNEEMKLAMLNSPSPGSLADLVAFSLSLDVPEAQDFIETLVVKKRFAKLLVYLKREKDVADIQKKIVDEVNDKVNKYQREYFLKEQLKVIRQELGLDEDDKGRDVKKIKDTLLKAKMPEDVEKVALEELGKLETVPDSSPEYNIIRTYLNLLVNLPWNKATVEKINIKNARKILDSDHYGLEKAKERILEFLAVRKLRPEYDGTILCFAGPPGVGKTSLGKSISKALGREFYRFSLGGMRDEAEIKGHRRTYVGAMPGKIIQAIKRVGVNNPVIMLDEIDKLGQSFQGDPASALLEVLDPEQNGSFIDNYLDVPFDLSKVLFIATANFLGDIPAPLLDRMEVISLSGYSQEEKVAISEKWILPKVTKKHGLTKKDFSLKKSVLQKLILDYARGPGVRSLEQYLSKLCRKAALLRLEKKLKKFSPEKEELDKYLGGAIFQSESAVKKLGPGIVIGLAWTTFGGEILFIESIPLRGKGLKLTGQLGDVMSESANLAYSYVKKLLQDERREKGLEKKDKKEKQEKKEKKEKKEKRGKKAEENGEGLREVAQEKDYLATHEVHLHLPAGATPKDGPSAGISMALALYSLAHNKSVAAGMAMTGELSLSGKVLPIGGLKEKILAAKRAGIKTVIFPEQNKRDLKEVPAEHRKGLKLVPVKHFDEVLKVAFHKAPKVK